MIVPELPPIPDYIDLLSPRAAKVWDADEVLMQELTFGTNVRFGKRGHLLLFGTDAFVVDLNSEDAIGFFRFALPTVRSRETELMDGATYYASYLPVTLNSYKRLARGYLLLTDVLAGGWQDPNEVGNIADYLGLEMVPTIYYGPAYKEDGRQAIPFRQFRRMSTLGGLIAGIVVKNYVGPVFATQWNSEVVV